MTRPVCFLGASLDELRELPVGARREMGHQIDQVQCGLELDDWKPMTSVGAGVPEIRVRYQGGAFRLIYLSNRPEAVYVLRAFQKKSRATAKRDLEVAEMRLRTLKRSKP